jgi:hypothetical protein
VSLFDSSTTTSGNEFKHRWKILDIHEKVYSEKVIEYMGDCLSLRIDFARNLPFRFSDYNL